jgi:hypothetical protein
MKSLSTKRVLSAFGIAAMLTSPAFAQKLHRQPSQQEWMTSDPVRQNGRGIYDMVPSPNDPMATGGGSLGYNQSLHDDKW